MIEYVEEFQTKYPSIKIEEDRFIYDDLDEASTISKIHAMRKLGVPYEEGYEARANADLRKQAEEITAKLKTDKMRY